MRRSSSGLAALGLVGIYYMWRNRTQIQHYVSQFLESNNIQLSNLSGTKIKETVRNLADQVTEKVSSQRSDTISSSQKAV